MYTMSDIDEFPGETEFLNYDPENIDNVQDAIDFLSILVHENREKGELEAAGAYEDCVDFLETTLLEEQ